MIEINKDLKIPFYIFEEILEYKKITNNDYYRRSKMENIIALLKLAQVNNRLSELEVKRILYFNKTLQKIRR